VVFRSLEGGLAIMKSKRFLYAVLSPHAWDKCLQADGVNLLFPKNGPKFFLPVFETEEAATSWAGEAQIIKLEFSSRGKMN
jgi:hypothetical protein